jgi:hypothetical protein
VHDPEVGERVPDLGHLRWLEVRVGEAGDVAEDHVTCARCIWAAAGETHIRRLDSGLVAAG